MSFGSTVRGLEARIAEYERQLAEALAILSDLPDHSDVDAAVLEANALRAENARLQEQADTATETGLRVMKERDALQARVEEAEANFKEYNISCGCKAVQGAIVFTEVCRKHLSQGSKPGRLMGDDYARAAIEEEGKR